MRPQVVPWSLLALVGCAEAPTFDGWEPGGVGHDAAISPTVGSSAAQPSDTGVAPVVDTRIPLDASPVAGGMSGPDHDAATIVSSPRSDAGTTATDAGTTADDGGFDASARPVEAGAGGSGDAASDAGAASVNADAAANAATCVASQCTSRCALLPRCCNPEGRCACQDPITRECTLESL